MKKIEKIIKNLIFNYSVKDILDVLRCVLEKEECCIEKEYDETYNAFIKYLGDTDEKMKKQQHLTRKEMRQGNFLEKKYRIAQNKYANLAQLKSILLYYDEDLRPRSS